MSSVGPSDVAAMRRERAVLLLVGILFGAVGYWAHDPRDLSEGFMLGAPFGRDFVNFWLGTRRVLDGDAAILIDLERYNALIAETFRHFVDDRFVFSYPPNILVPLVPLAVLPYGLAVTLWTILNLAALGLTVRIVAGAMPHARWRVLALIAATSPATVTMVIFGHFGGLLALCSVVALKESERRPWLAGLCLAALSVKPQFALIVGLILLLAGRWRCIVVSACGTASLAAASVAAFGLEPWQNFLAWTVPYQSSLMVDFEPQMLRTLISVYFTTRFFVDAGTAWTLQGIVSLAAILGATVLLRRGRAAAPADQSLILLAALVALPYANAYDLAIVAPALTVWLFGPDAERPPVSLVVLWVLPPVIWMLSCNGITCASLPIAAALFLGLRERLRVQAPCAHTASFTPHRATT